MTLALLAAWFPPVIVAWLAVSIATRSIPASPSASILRIALTVPLALGLGSITCYAWLILSRNNPRGFAFAESITLVILALALAVALQKTKSRAERVPAPTPARPNPWLVAAVAALALFAAVALASESRAAPHGNWDASSIWNLRARFLYRAGPNWPLAFSPQISWSHPDYPLLLPAAVARSWRYLGNESQLAPAAISIAFTIFLIAMLAAAVSVLRGPALGLIAALAMLATDPLIRLGADQYADIPLATMMLATTLCLCIALRSAQCAVGPCLLAGLFTGLACWTKNEGLPFATILMAILIFRAAKTAQRRPIAAFVAGLLPIALVVAHFKLKLAPSNDLIAASTPGELLHRLLDWRRHATAAPRFAWAVLSFGKGIPVALAAAAFFIGRRPRHQRNGAWFPATLAVAMTTTYYLIYVATPHDIAWHVNRSATRLLLQIYPLALLAGFMIIASPDEQSAPATPSLSPST